MKNKNLAAPRNEGVTIMMAIAEKSTYIDYCEKKGVSLSEMGRIAINEKMMDDETVSDSNIDAKTEEVMYELIDKNKELVRRNAIQNRNIVVLKELLQNHNIIIPEGLLRSHNSRMRVLFP